MFKQSLHYAKLSENKNYICSAYYDLGKVYSVLFDFDNSIKYYKEAIQMAERSILIIIIIKFLFIPIVFFIVFAFMYSEQI